MERIYKLTPVVWQDLYPVAPAQTVGRWAFWHPNWTEYEYRPGCQRIKCWGVIRMDLRTESKVCRWTDCETGQARERTIHQRPMGQWWSVALECVACHCTHLGSIVNVVLFPGGI
jgi:hypothetical protein